MRSDMFTAAYEATIRAMNRSKKPMHMPEFVSRKKVFVPHFRRILDYVFNFF